MSRYATDRQYDWHPLELIPFFRRWPCSLPRDLLYTLLWNSAIFVLIAAISLLFSDSPGSARQLWQHFVICQSVGYSIHALFQLGGRLVGHWLGRMPRWVHYGYFMFIPTLGVFIGYAIGFSLLDMTAARRYFFSAEGVRAVLLFALFISGLLCVMFISRDRQRQTELALATERQRALDADRRALEAQLRMLQAQIEPHFLYNTLANAVGLISPAPERARHLLESLIDYLRASLASSRQAETRLDRELATLAAYLELMRVRMGERLRYQIDCPPALGSCALPPMLLQPLVENAIQHGLEPTLAGGEVRIAVACDGGQLVIRIGDNGQGFAPASLPARAGGGVGLANLRERLASLYGQAASLHLAEQSGGGICATLRLPQQPSTEAAG